MTPFGRVFQVAAEQTIVRGRGEELDRYAAVVAASEARLAVEARNVGFDGYAVAGLQGGDGGAHGENCAGGFVTQDVRVFDYHGAYAALRFLSVPRPCVF